MPVPTWLTTSDDGIVVEVYVQPGARCTALAGTFDGLPRIRLASRPNKGKANRELIRFLARGLGVPSGDVTIVSGQKSRRKRVAVSGSGISRAAIRLLDPSTDPSTSSGPS